MRIVWALLGWVASAVAVGGEAPIVCTVAYVNGNGTVVSRQQYPVEDLATGKLPIPDYQDTAFDCGKKTGRLPKDLSVGTTDSSPWLESERARYVAILAKQRADLLVVPLQVQSYGLDRIERAVMTADLAYAIGDAGSLRVADPFLAALALGEGRRRIDERKVHELALRIGARKILFAYVGHDLRRNFTLTLELKEESAGVAPVLWRKDWRSIPFTNEKTPAYVLHEMLPAILKELPLGLTPKPAVATAVAANPSRITVTPRELVSTNSQSTSNLATMSLLATLVPREAEAARERLFERTLVAALRTSSAKPSQRFLEAHALFNLHRRPRAIARIQGATGASFTALRALLDGNLPDARKATKSVKDPFEQLLLQLLVRDLEYQYEIEEPTQPSAAEALFPEEKTAVAWAPLLLTRLEDGNAWFVPEAHMIKVALDAAFPVKELELESLVRGNSVARGTPPDTVDIDLASIRHAHKVASTLEVASCCRTRDLKPTARDLLWLLEGSAEERINAGVELMVHVQGLNDSALTKVAAYDSLLKGHPRMSTLAAWAAYRISEKSPDDMRANWTRRMVDDARIAARSFPGQSPTTYEAVWLLGVSSRESAAWLDIYGYDFPRRPHWPIESLGLNTRKPEGQALWRAMQSEGHAFSSSDLTMVEVLSDGVVGEEEGKAVIASLGSRFVGHPKRPASEPPPTTAEGRIAAARAAAETDANQYRALGHEIVWSERPLREARDAFMKHPQFRAGDARNPVGLSNDTYDVGSIFFFLGQPALAKPFFQIAADLHTGSNASLGAQQRLLMFEGRYREAADIAQRRSQRYSKGHSQRDYLSFLHAFGEHEAAWSAFSQWSSSQDDYTLWNAALVGHRMQRMDEKALRAWLRKPEIRELKVKGAYLAASYALMWTTTDRAPPADLGTFIEELQGPVAVVKGPPAHPASRAGPGSQGARPAGPPPRFRSERAHFADGYSAVVRGDYAKAVEHFTQLRTRYPLEASAVPYVAYAASKTGDSMKFEAMVNEPKPDDYRSFDRLLARAFFAAGRKRVDDAYRLLNQSFRAKPFTGNFLVNPHWQFAQACEWLYRDTRDPRFAATLLEWAKGYQAIEPTTAWGYAIEYQYSKDPEARHRALAMTLYLDPLSERIHTAPKADVDKARAWLAKNNPFLIKERSQEDGDPKRRTVAAVASAQR